MDTFSSVLSMKNNRYSDCRDVTVGFLELLILAAKNWHEMCFFSPFRRFIAYETIIGYHQFIVNYFYFQVFTISLTLAEIIIKTGPLQTRHFFTRSMHSEQLNLWRHGRTSVLTGFEEQISHSVRTEFTVFRATKKNL